MQWIDYSFPNSRISPYPQFGKADSLQIAQAI